jgi:DAK2 domain fusion protein YloV
MVTTDAELQRVERQIRLAGELRQCDGFGMKRLAKAATDWLETNHATVNALNVFPVPDGDTGTNMLLTMRAACQEIENTSELNASKVAAAIAQGALMGARGNSGVILSQIWRGFAHGLGTAEAFDVPLLVQALQGASATAYRGVVKPVEGTILTVIKDTAAAAEAILARPDHTLDLRAALEELAAAANASVARTPDLMPLLKQAGVVDAGGKGLAVILDGMLRYLRGQRLDESNAPPPAPLNLAAVGAAIEAAEPGQEWEVVLDFRPRTIVHLPTLYSRLAALGASIQVGEGEGLFRVHIHLLKSRRHEPIELAEEWGTVVNVHMENLLDQMETSQAKAEPALVLADVQPGQIGAVAISPGAGLSRVMGSLGAGAIVGGGQTKNPSTQDILDAINGLPTDRIIVLPNNKNIILAAQQAAGMSTKQVRIVPTRTVPQGMAALLSLIPEGDLDEVRGAMERGMASVESGEVTTASRSVELNGVAVTEGQIIGLRNGALAVAGASVPAVVLGLLEKMGAAERELVTLYYGADVSAEAAGQMASTIRGAYPNLTVEMHAGGQPHYDYLLSVE